MTIVICIVCLLFGIFVVGMLGLHTYLTCRNLTTAEYLKKYYKMSSGNPFEKYAVFHSEPSSLSTSSSCAGAFVPHTLTCVGRCAETPMSRAIQSSRPYPHSPPSWTGFRLRESSCSFEARRRQWLAATAYRCRLRVRICTSPARTAWSWSRTRDSYSMLSSLINSKGDD